MRVFLDTNIIIDIIAQREFGEDATKVFEMCANGRIDGFISSVSYLNIMYILRKEFSRTDLRTILRAFGAVLMTVPINHTMVMQALRWKEFSDFEDCIQVECAMEANVDYIITRNPKDFVLSDIKCVKARELLNLLNLE